MILEARIEYNSGKGHSEIHGKNIFCQNVFPKYKQINILTKRDEPQKKGAHA